MPCASGTRGPHRWGACARGMNMDRVPPSTRQKPGSPAQHLLPPAQTPLGSRAPACGALGRGREAWLPGDCDPQGLWGTPSTGFPLLPFIRDGSAEQARAKAREAEKQQTLRERLCVRRGLQGAGPVGRWAAEGAGCVLRMLGTRGSDGHCARPAPLCPGSSVCGRCFCSWDDGSS